LGSDFPTVRIVDAAPGRIVTQTQLDALGLVALPEPAPAVIPLRSRRKHSAAEGERTWPDYQRCVTGAPPNQEGSGPDRSMADFFWCMMAAQRGWEHRGNRKQANGSERQSAGARTAS